MQASTIGLPLFGGLCSPQQISGSPAVGLVISPVYQPGRREVDRRAAVRISAHRGGWADIRTYERQRIELVGTPGVEPGPQVATLAWTHIH